MKKRLTAFVLAILLPLVTLLGMWTPMEAHAAVGTTFIVHYGGRADNDYTGWNMWIWEEGFDGSAVEFTAEDDFGKIAMYQCTENTDRIGFIVRLNEWEAKDVETDRYVEINGNTVEIWVTSGVEEFATTAPVGCEPYDFSAAEETRLGAYDKEEALKVNVHYYTYSEDYAGVQCYAALGENAGGIYPKVENDEYGAVYHAGFLDYENESEVKLSMSIDGVTDTKYVRTVDISKAKDGVLDVYTVEGNPEVWYAESDADKTPIIVSAGFEETTKKILFKVSKAVDTSDPQGEGSHYTVKDSDGNSYPIQKAWSESGSTVTDAYIIMDEPLDASKSYYLEREGYKGCAVDIAGAFSSEAFEESYTYEGNDLGQTYTDEKTILRVWAPTASEVKLNLYEAGEGDCLIDTYPMTKDVQGTWVYELEGDQHGVYYTYSVTVDGNTEEAVDPYAKAVGVNGNRGMIVDLDSTDPDGWENDKHVTVENNTDAIIYEIHVRDTTIDESSGVENKGKYLGLTETGTTTESGIKTALDHIVELGVTHVQIMPSYDFGSIDESKPDEPQYNWGYDPINYNVPEGSFSTDPFHGEVRIKEYKEMVQGFHKQGLGVIMDVVYNHTYDIDNNCFQKCVPDYYYRMTEDGEYSDASACGNEVASDHPMVRKFIIDSLKYWVSEYHIDGFRFDLMGVLDIETMNLAAEELRAINPEIIIYGEGWAGGPSTLPDKERALKCNVPALVGVGAFSDDIRDGIRGDVFIEEEIGFISGRQDMENDIRYSVVGATRHPEIDYDAYEYSEGPWAKNPVDIVNYISCHDNLTLWDKISVSCPNATEEEKLAMNRLGAGMIFTSQGIPFFLSGEEFARTKPIEGTDEVCENSYNMPFYTNVMRYDRLEKYSDLNEYYKGIIAFRKAHEGLRLGTAEEVRKAVHFIDGLPKNVVAFTVTTEEETIFVVYNGNKEAVKVDLPEAGAWDICIDNDKASKDALRTTTESDKMVEVQGVACFVAVK